MNELTAVAVRQRACESKHKLSMTSAREMAQRLNVSEDRAAHRGGDQRALRAYRCPFCGKWHVGGVPSLEELQELADAVRFFATGYQGDPR